MAKKDKRTRTSHLAAFVLAWLALVGASAAWADTGGFANPCNDLRSVTDLPRVKGEPGWHRYEGKGFGVDVPADWSYSTCGELRPPRPPRSTGGWGSVEFTGYQPRDEGDLWRWEQWVREHVRGKRTGRLWIGRNPAVMEEHVGHGESDDWIFTYIGVKSVGHVFVFSLEGASRRDSGWDSLVKTYRRMLRSMRLDEKALEQF
jgi:hypothetical protein